MNSGLRHNTYIRDRGKRTLLFISCYQTEVVDFEKNLFRNLFFRWQHLSKYVVKTFEFSKHLFLNHLLSKNVRMPLYSTVEVKQNNFKQITEA